MALIDTLKDTVTKILPQKNEPSIPKPGSLLHDDRMIVSKPAIVAYAFGSFFAFLTLACFAAVAAFQAKFKVGPSGLSGFAIFVSLVGMLLALFMLLVPVIYEKYDKLIRLSRALQEVRVGFILSGIGLTLTFLLSFITTISAWTQPGCKDASKDPNASKGDDFKNGLPGWCTTKKAGAIFFWLSAICWMAIFVLRFLDWRSGKSVLRADPNFRPPSQMVAHEEFDDDSDDEARLPIQAPQLPVFRRSTNDDTAVTSPFSDENRYRPEGAPRPSMDTYGAFDDPPPSGYGPSTPGVSRTMQYADPYAAVRANISGAQPSTPQPPSYEYEGYR